MHFLTLPDSKNEREHETVAFLKTSRQQKRARMRYCPYFLARRSYGKPQSAILSSLSPPEGAKMRDCQHFFLTFAPLSGNTADNRRQPPHPPPLSRYTQDLRDQHFCDPSREFCQKLSPTQALPDSKNVREHETVAFFDNSRQQKRAGTRDCCIF